MSRDLHARENMFMNTVRQQKGIKCILAKSSLNMRSLVKTGANKLKLKIQQEIQNTELAQKRKKERKN